MTTEHHISIQKSARYFVHGEIDENKHLLVALHGYGHLAQYFIRKFQSLDFSKYVVVCPEAPHRFYLDEKHSRVGASWMTKEDRENDVNDYLNYLDTLVEHLTATTKFKSVNLLGFSQGGATASRWIAQGRHSFDRFMLWSSLFPPDIAPENCLKLNNSKNYFVFGTKDEYYSNESIQAHFHELGQLNIQFEMLTFDGNHNIHEETLLSILDE